MTRWMHPPQVERERIRDAFDPIVIGAQHGLPAELARAIWDRVCAETTDASGRIDLALAQRRFREIAARMAGRRGLRPDVGRTTRVAELDERPVRRLGDDLRAAPRPGRETLVEREARRWQQDPSFEEVAERAGERSAHHAPGIEMPTAADLRLWSRTIDVGQLFNGGHVRDQRRDGSASRALRRPLSPVPSGRPPLEARRADAGRAPLDDVRRDDAGRASLDGARRADAGRADIDHAPPRVISGDAEMVREAVRLYRTGELAAALRRGEPGLADAVATALHEGTILAPHPVDVFRDSVRGLGAELTMAGRSAGRAALRLLGTTPLAPAGQRAFAFADAVSGGAARAWSDRARGWADGMARRAMAFSERSAARDAEEELGKLSATGGMPLSTTLRARMESLFGHRFGHVRIHTDDAAAQAAEAAGARAVTLGSNIYFGRGRFAPGTEAGDRLLLHELTHVVQHDHGRLPDPSSGRVELSSPSDATEREAREMEGRASELSTQRDAREMAARATERDPIEPRSAPANATPSTRAPAPQQPVVDASTAAARRVPAEGAAGPASARGGRRASPDILGDAAHWVGDRVDDAKEWAADQIEGLVMKAAPGLATLIKEGPGGLIKNAIQPAISGWIGTVTGGVDIGKIAGQLKGSFTSAFKVLEGAKSGDPKCCETLVSGINAIREVAEAFMNNPVMDAIKGAFTKVSEIIGTVTKLVIGPAFEVLKTIVGGAWDAIKSVASTIQGWISTVKKIASQAFDWVAKKLGFPSGTGEGGLLDWLQKKAAEIWEDIKKTLQPVMGPLKVVAGVLAMCSGLGEIYLIIKYGPQVIEAIKWLWANRNNPDAVKQNPGGIGGTILPKILGAGQSFVGFVKKGAAWLVEKITAFATGALDLLGAITGVPLLSMARGFVQTMVDGVKNVQDWATGAFTGASQWLEGLFHQVADFIKPYAEVLCSVATAIINPAGIPFILAGWAWRWLPDCIKPPLIDLLLDAVISFLRGMPSLPMLGPLWPLLKSGVLGFLGAVRAKDDHTKIAVSNKLAKIISGASPAFLFGFVKGLLKGVWDGIKMPFEAIYMIVKGIEKAGDFFTALGNDADTKAKPKASQPPAKPGAPTPTQHHPLPGTPAVITEAQASSVVGGIVSQLNAQKPPPPKVAGTTQPAAQTSGNDYQQLAHQAKRMGGELAGPSQTVATQFMPAVKELFSGGKGMSIDDLMAKLHTVWEAAKNAVSKLGAQIANMIIDFLMKDSAEEEIGDAIGYLVGMIAFQAVVDAFSAGAWSEVSVVLTAIAKFLNWPMKFLGEAMGLMKKLGGFILDGLKSLGSMVAEAGAGALREVTGALRQIAGKLGEFADELLAKFGGKAESTAAHSAEGDAARALENDAAGAVERDANAAKANEGKPTEGKPSEGKPNEASVAEKEAEKAEELAEALAISKAILHAEDAGHIPGPAIAMSLESLKGRYRWIKAFEARPHGPGYTVFLIASETKVDDTHEGGSPVPGGAPNIAPGAVGTYPETIEWGIHPNLPARPAPPGYWGRRIPQSNPGVEAFEMKINPNNESFYLPHPDGGFVQFENAAGGVVQDGKLIGAAKQSLYRDFASMPPFAREKILAEARRQVAAAGKAGMSVEWLVSDATAARNLEQLFAEKGVNLKITVTVLPP